MAGKTGKRLRAERLFLLVYIPLVVAMMLAVPIGEAPDEPAHLRQSWLVSTGQLRGDEYTFPENYLSIVNASYSNPEMLDRETLLETRLSEETVTVYRDETTGIYPRAAYLPQGLMMFLARQFTDRIGILLYSARTGCMLIAGILFYFAIRRIPAGKYTLLAIACLPLTLQEAASASCDGMTIAGVSWMISELLRRIDGNGDRPAKQLAASACIGLLAVLCKLMYVPVLLIALMPREKAGESRKQRILNRLATAGVLLAALLVWYLSSVSAQAGGDGMTASAIDRLRELAGNPLSLARAQVRTVAAYLPGWTRQMFGVFGHLNRFAPWTLAVPLGVSFLGIAVCDSGVRSLMPDRKQALLLRVLLILAFILCWTLLSGSLMIWWTGEENTVIEGIQARYFLPCLICLLLCLPEIRTREIREGRRVSVESVRAGILAVYLALSAATVAWLGTVVWKTF